VEVPDKPGGLHSIMEAVSKAGINVEYLYALPWRKAGRTAVIIFRFDAPEKAIEVLTKNKFYGDTGKHSSNDFLVRPKFQKATRAETCWTNYPLSEANGDDGIVKYRSI